MAELPLWRCAWRGLGATARALSQKAHWAQYNLLLARVRHDWGGQPSTNHATKQTGEKARSKQVTATSHGDDSEAGTLNWSHLLFVAAFAQYLPKA